MQGVLRNGLKMSALPRNLFQGKMEGTCQSRNLEYSINFCKTIIIVLLMILYVFSNKFKSDENLGGKV